MITEHIGPRVYLASRYSRRLELCEHRTTLKALGVEVTGRWLNGGHQVDDQGITLGEVGVAEVEEGSPLAGKFAQDDVEDVDRADSLILFTNEPRSAPMRGGAFVEMGLALAWGKPVIVVGPRANVFCWLPGVMHFDDWGLFLAWATS